MQQNRLISPDPYLMRANKFYDFRHVSLQAGVLLLLFY